MDFNASVTGTFLSQWPDALEDALLSINGADAAPVALSTMGDGGGAATFSTELMPDGSGAYSIASLWPASAFKAYDKAAGSFAFNVPSVQTPPEGVPSLDVAVLGAFVAGTDIPRRINLPFSHLTSYGKLTLSGIPEGEQLHSIVLEAPSPWAGDWIFAPGAGSVAAAPQGASTAITLLCGRTSELWFSCIPAALGEAQIGVYASTGRAVYSGRAQMPAEQGLLPGMPFQLRAEMTAADAGDDLAVWTMTEENMIARNGGEWSTEKDALRDVADHTILADAAYPDAYIKYINYGSSTSNMPAYEIWKKTDPYWNYRISHARHGSSIEICVPVRKALPAGTSVGLSMALQGNSYVVKNWLTEFLDGEEWVPAPRVFASGKASVELVLDTIIPVENTFRLSSGVEEGGVLHFRITPVNTSTVISGKVNDKSAYMRIYGGGDAQKIRVFTSGEDAPLNGGIVPLKAPAEAADYDVFGLGEFPVSMWWAPIWAYSTRERYQEMHDCGINVLDYVGEVDLSPDANLQVLDWCKEIGMKMLGQHGDTRSSILSAASDSDYTRFDTMISDYFSKYAAHEAYAGEHFIDEPSKAAFPALEALSKKYRAAFPGKICYVNLYPTYASTDLLGAENYEDYLDSWLATEGVTSVSFDSYPLHNDGSILPDYFYNLDIIRAKTRARHIPYWVFVQTTAHGSKKAPSENELRWLVGTCYLYGSKGIQYFCYWQPDPGAFGPALMDREGNRTERYEYARRLNADFKFISDALLQCHAEGVIQHSSLMYKQYSGLSCCGPLRAVRGGDVNVGCFVSTSGEYKYLLLGQLPGQGPAEVELVFSSNVQKLRVTTVEGSRTAVPTDGGRLSLTVPEGQPCLLEIVE